MLRAKTGSVYVWDLTVPGGACGVSHEEASALSALTEALRAAPVGAEGIVRGATLPIGLRQGYIYTDPIKKGRHTPAGTIAWTDGDDTW